MFVHCKSGKTAFLEDVKPKKKLHLFSEVFHLYSAIKKYVPF